MRHTLPVHEGAAASGPHTWDDFVALDEDDRRELIDGELVEVEVPRGRHESVVAEIIAALVPWARAHGGGRVLASGYKVRISERRGVMPDVQFFRPGNDPLPRQDDALLDGRPDLVVEVVSPSSRRYDRIVKARYYAAIGVPEYWIVDPDARTIERLVLDGGRWVIATATAGDEPFEPPGFEGLRVDLGAAWAGPTSP